MLTNNEACSFSNNIPCFAYVRFVLTPGRSNLKNFEASERKYSIQLASKDFIMPDIQCNKYHKQTEFNEKFCPQNLLFNIRIAHSERQDATDSVPSNKNTTTTKTTKTNQEILCPLVVTLSCWPSYLLLYVNIIQLMLQTPLHFSKRVR